MSVEYINKTRTSRAVLPTAITPGASPYTYYNTNGFEADVIVSAGTVSALAFSRNNVTYYACGFVNGMVHLSPGDYLQVTYTVAPTMTLVPR